MESKNKLTVADEFKKNNQELVDSIVKEKDPNKLKNLTQLFEMNQKKKDIVRANKLSNMADILDNELISRVNDDLPDGLVPAYADKIQRSLSDTLNRINQAPAIQINTQNNEFNLGQKSGLDKESRARVIDAITKILKESEDK